MEMTLLLNADYLPMDVVNWQRAMTLWFQDKVEIIETHDREAWAVSFSFKLPSVVRLLRYARVGRRPEVQFSRANIYTRDNYKCQYCLQQCASDDLTFDHVIPVSQGGGKSWDNIVSCCLKCNRKKGARTPEEAEMVLTHRPKKPAYSPIFRVTMGIRRVPKNWMDYIYWNTKLDDGGGYSSV